ncbi:MAG: hypothetical protein ACOX8W_02960 [bacterium]
MQHRKNVGMASSFRAAMPVGIKAAKRQGQWPRRLSRGRCGSYGGPGGGMRGLFGRDGGPESGREAEKEPAKI